MENEQHRQAIQDARAELNDAIWAYGPDSPWVHAYQEALDSLLKPDA